MLEKYIKAWIYLKKGYRSRTNLKKKRKGLSACRSEQNFDQVKRNTCHLLNVHVVSDVRQTEIHGAEPLVPEPSGSEFKMVTEKFKMYKSPAFHFPGELIQAGGRRLCCVNHKLCNSIFTQKEPLNSGRSQLLYIFMRWQRDGSK